MLEFEGLDEVPTPGPPLICIPTTAGTSADVSQFSIITDTSRNVKIAIISKTVVPDVALIDPETTTTMFAELTAATGMDALVHAIEAYVSNASSPITDLNALAAISRLAQNLVPAIENPRNMEYRNNMMMGSLLAGLAFSNASLGLVHAMAHSLGGLLDMPHGMCNALLLEHVLDFNYPAVPERYNQIGLAMGLKLDGLGQADCRETLSRGVARPRERAGIKTTIGALGVTPKDIPSSPSTRSTIRVWPPTLGKSACRTSRSSMNKRSEPEAAPQSLRDKIIGLGERSLRKSYYPQLQQQLKEVEKSRTHLEEKSAALLNVLADLEEGRKKQAASEAHLHAIVETTPDGVMLIAADGTLLQVNEAGLTMIECESAEAAIGQCFYPMIAPEFRKAFRSFNEGACRGDPGVLQFECIGLKGVRRWLETHAAPLCNPSNDTLVHLAVMRDITERKRAEESLAPQCRTDGGIAPVEPDDGRDAGGDRELRL